MKPYILLDCSGGNFNDGTTLPGFFCRTVDLKNWGFDRDHIIDIKDNMVNERTDIYWQQWEEVVRDALHIDENGQQWRVEQDENNSLWAVPVPMPKINLKRKDIM